MKTFISEGMALQVLATAAFTAGVAMKIGSLIGIPATSGQAGDTFTLWRVGNYSHAAATSQSWAQGDTLYWDDTNKVFTKTATNNTKAAIAAEDKQAAAATGSIVLVPTI